MGEPAALTDFRNALLKRGVSSIKSMGRHFRKMDDNRDYMLKIDEFKKGLRECGVEVSESGVEEMFIYFDKDGNGAVDFEEFLEKLRAMSPSRKEIVEKAFKKFDKSGDGVVTIKDMQKSYNPNCNPKFESGELSIEQCFVEYLTQFDEPNNPDGKITLEEFMNYYSGLSNSIDNDAYFELMIRNAWKL